MRASVTSTTGQVVTGRAVRWASDSANIVRVDPATGMVTAVAVGRARVTASLGAGTGGIDLNVVPKPSAFIVGAGSGRGSGTIRSTPAGIDCHVVAGQPQNACSFTFLGDAQVTLTASPDSGAVFGSWGQACDGASSGATCTLDGSQVRNLSATFIALRGLTVGVTGTGGGTVRAASGIACSLGNEGVCKATYLDNTEVTLSASTSEPNVFVGWTGVCADSTGPRCTVTLGRDLLVGAQFSAPLGLAVMLTGTGGGTVTFTGANGTTTTCTLARGGTPSGSCGATVPYGTTVTLTATPNAASSFSGWTGPCTGAGSCTVKVQDVAAVGATFTQRMVNLNLTLNGAASGAGSVSVNGSTVCTLGGSAGATTCQVAVPAGDPLTLSAAPANGADFTGWGGCPGGTAACTLTLFADASLTASFGPSPLVLTVEGVGGSSGTGTVAANTGPLACTLAGGVPGGSCSMPFATGARIVLLATPSSNSIFGGWGGACTGSTGTSCTVTPSAATTVSARFDVVQYILQVSTAGTGNGAVSGTPDGVNCPGPCTANFVGGSVVTLTATPSAGSTFGGWSGACTGTSRTCTVTMNAARSVTATFSAVVPTYALSVTTAGAGTGSVGSSPSGIGCPETCSASYTAGTAVTLTATPTNGSTFAGWSGSGCSGTGSCTVTMSAARSVTATFDPPLPPSFTLTVTTGGTGTGSVTSSVGGIDCPGTCSASLVSGTTVTLTATPGQNSTFGGWGGACANASTTCVVTMDAAKSVSASFSAVIPAYLLSVVTNGTGTGTVGSSPSGIACPGTCSTSYPSGTSVTLTATAANGSTFAGWSGASCTGTSTCTVTMSAARNVTATFNLLPQTFALSVGIAGTGSGAVASSPGPIDCPGLCSATFNAGTVVTLTATPSSGSSFGGWTGACTNLSLTCSVTMDAAKSVTATFTTVPTSRLTVTVFGDPGNGTVTSSPAGINCGAGSTCSFDYASGTTVTLTATPGTGAVFGGWSGGPCNNSTSPTCTLPLNAATSVSARFRITS
jgi:hypothetical protein